MKSSLLISILSRVIQNGTYRPQLVGCMPRRGGLDHFDAVFRSGQKECLFPCMRDRAMASVAIVRRGAQMGLPLDNKSRRDIKAG